MMFDPSDPIINQIDFEKQDLATSEFVNLQREGIPDNISEPRGLGFVMVEKVDSDFDSYTVTCWSSIVFLVFLNCAPIYYI